MCLCHIHRKCKFASCYLATLSHLGFFFFFIAQKLAGVLICEATKTHFLTGVWQQQTNKCDNARERWAHILLYIPKMFSVFSRETTFPRPSVVLWLRQTKSGWQFG